MSQSPHGFKTGLKVHSDQCFDFLYSPHCWGGPPPIRSPLTTRTEPAKNHDFTSIHRDSPLVSKITFTIITAKFSTLTPRILTPVDSRSSYPAEPACGKFHPLRCRTPESSHSKSCKTESLYFCSFTTRVLCVQKSTKVRRDILLPDLMPILRSPAPPSGRQYTGVHYS